MHRLLEAARHDLFDPTTLMGASFLDLAFLVAATVLATVVGRTARRIEAHLTDTTGLRFAVALGQLLVYLVGFILYAHLIPQLRALVRRCSQESVSCP